ncbi:transcription factor bHLH112-like [Abrus precatorius]|uniref:Transcription factor bHLH112-like n=1 Tax=Abrus precatorius TaxID=3816 RepID=A0A8B8KWA0_ABRPR|nr:transcription factor bHLH112-like [Abrus precatorius]
MAEEFQARICGENWWSSIDSTRSVFPLGSTSPCSVAANDIGNYSTRQTSDIMDLKAIKCSAEETNNNLVSDSYLGFVDAQKPQKSESASESGSILIDSTIQMMGFGLTSPSSANWNQPPLFRCNGRSESNFHSMLQEETGIDSSNSQIQRDWIPKSFSSTSGGTQVSTVDTFKPMNQDFSIYQRSLSSLTSTEISDRSFPIGSASYGSPSTLMQSLYDEPQPQLQHPLFTNRPMSYSSKASYGTPSNEIPPIWSKVSTFLKPTPIAKQHPIGLHFSNNTPFWNASAEALNDIRAGTSASSQSQYQTPTFEEKPNCPSSLLNKLKSEETLDSASMEKQNVCEAALKRPRIETPSPLPTFKVRKEKLGDRVTALQQLVSPFGKTDTASVLHEAIEYIKFLHDQVNVLSTSYMKSGAPIQQQQGCDDVNESEGPKQDLKSRGLCLVPISSTFPVATETTADFSWTPTFRGALPRRMKQM